MFSVRLQQLIYVCDRIVVRNLRNSRIYYPTANPGLGRRIKAFQDSGFKIEDEDAEEFIEASQSDFGNVGEAYNDYMNESLMAKYQLGHRIVKQKYFKENLPNLLTWSEKEQIRHLAASAPDEWTPEKIAESFPVTVPVVKKLLKFPWKPATEQRIARHDASVMRNWRELKEDTCSIPDDLKNHFLKFSERTIPPLKKSSIKVDVTQEEKLGEFERIVYKCAAKENIEQQDNKEDTTHETNNQVVNKKKYFKRMTLNELTEKIQKRLDSGKDIDMNDEILIKSMSDRAEIQAVIPNSEIELQQPEDNDKALTEFKTDDKKNNIMDYPERIRIPKKAYKKGATYKVNDCYYDHDGKFLYRVLGM